MISFPYHSKLLNGFQVGKDGGFFNISCRSSDNVSLYSSHFIVSCSVFKFTTVISYCLHDPRY